MKTENESREMYLKTIRTLEKSASKVRNVDIARVLGYSKPSVTVAIKKLASDGYVVYNRQSGVSLTSLGRNTAEELARRYDVLYDFFVAIGAEKTVAEENACRMEHQITGELFAVIQTVLREISVKR